MADPAPLTSIGFRLTRPAGGGRPARRRAWAVVVAGALAACGGSDDGASVEQQPPTPTEPTATETSEPAESAEPAPTEPAESTEPDDPAVTTAPEVDPDTPVPWFLDEPVERADSSVFDYEPVRPVAYEVIGTEKFRGVEMQRIKFENSADGFGYGYLSLPVGEPAPGVGVLWGHGAPVDGTDSFHPMSVYACAGATSIVVEAPYAHPGALRQGEAFTWTPQDRDEQIQLIIDMRRGLDILTDLGAERFGFGAISYGASMGGQLIGVDDRVEAALLLLGDGGVLERFTDEQGEPTWEIAGLSDDEREAWFDAMLPIEPSRYIGDSAAKILFMNGLEDPIIPPPEAERYHAAARPGHEVMWMDIGHDISFEDFVFHNRWLGEQIGMDPQRLEDCTREIFPNGFDDA